jgi:chromosomal replication initiation ATPase DnaA
MKSGHFVENLSNHVRFLEALKNIDQRGAPEANWLLLEGEPGFGKTKLVTRHGLQLQCPMVRAKADWTPKWALTDIADACNIQRYRTTQDLSQAVMADLMEKQARRGFCLIVDEIDHAARNVRVLETLRDLTDGSECILIASGMKGVSKRLKAHAQIYSRIDQFVEFAPATVKDVRQMAAALVPDTKISDAMIEEIQKRTMGRIRLVMGALARIEAFARRLRAEVTPENYRGQPLLSDERQLQLTVVGG